MDGYFLSSVSLFAGLAPKELEWLEAHMIRRIFPEGTLIFNKGDRGDGLYIIRFGLVKIFITSPDDRETDIAILYPNDCFGEMAALDEGPRSASAIALDKTETLYLSRRDLLFFLETCPRVALRFINLLARRLRETDDKLVDLVVYDISGRLAKKLLELADSFGSTTSEGIAVPTPFTQQDLANMIGSTRESVNKVLKLFRDRGYITMNNRRLTIRSRKGLERSYPSSIDL
ncbi:MAG: Crp/Fnr family transcriptional regulator [Chloroflexi bacterium]|nr:Crp/Fnr family transcriptional regulator [Chloroflexota bacterium]